MGVSGYMYMYTCHICIGSEGCCGCGDLGRCVEDEGLADGCAGEEEEEEEEEEEGGRRW
jgi:hypothetical protein